MALGNAVNANTTGFQSLNAATGVWNGRTLTPGTGISITNQDGTGGNPTISSTGVSPPNTNAIAYEEFYGLLDVNNPSFFTCMLPWYNNGGIFVFNTANNEAGHPGIVGNIAFTSTGWLQAASDDATTFRVQAYPIFIDGGQIVLTWIFKIATLSAASPRYILTFGFEGSGSTDFIQFRYSDNVNSGKWVIETEKASTPTSTNTNTTVATGWHNAVITINTGATSVNFTLDGVSLGDIATNIPTSTSLTYFFKVESPVGTIAANSLLVDAMYFNQTLSR